MSDPKVARARAKEKARMDKRYNQGPHIEESSRLWVPGSHHGKRFTNGPHNLDQARACIKYCGKSRRGLAIDGGAYVGTFSRQLQDTFTKVLAFEPGHFNFECLKLNVGSNVECTHAALTSKVCDMDLVEATRFRSYSWQVSQLPGGDYQGISIDSLNLQELDLLKLDVEGHELAALIGAKTTIRKFKPVIMIEEKLEEKKFASRWLNRLGYEMVWQKKHDYIFITS